ncbi:MAG: polysaccharide deacetylase family protein [bacterium]
MARALAAALLIAVAAGCAGERGDTARDKVPVSAAVSETAALAEAEPKPQPERTPSDNSQFEGVSNELIQWGVRAAADGTPPGIPGTWARLLARYGAVWLGDTAKKEVFLTFDAGYEAGYTSGLLDVLKEEGVTAAFFLAGHYVRSQPELVKRMAAEGHTVASHGYGHLSMPSLDVPEMRDEILAVSARAEALTGKKMRYFRPPKGEFSERALAVARGLGYVTVLWSLGYKDWEPMPGGSDESYRILMSRLHPGAVILLHAISKDNAEALQRMIQGIKAGGYAFGSLDELTRAPE